MLKKLFTHTAIYGLAPQVPKIAGVLALPIITPFLTGLDFGVYGVVTAVSGAISVLSILGLRISLVNSFYKSPEQYKWGWRQIYGFLTLWNIPYAMILAIVFSLFIPHEAAGDRFLIILLNVLPVVFFGPTLNIGTTYYQLVQKPMQIAVRTMIFGSLTVLLNIYFIAYLKKGYMGWFISNCIATMLNNLSYWIPLNRRLRLSPIFNFKWRLIKKSLSVSLPTVPHYYSSYLLNGADRIVMRILNVPTNAIGLYNAANTVGNLFMNVGNAAGLAVGPLMNASYKAKKDGEARKLIFLLQITFFVITFLSSIWLKEIFWILIKNESLRSVYRLGVIIVMSYNYRPMYLGASNKLFYIEKTKVLLKITLVAGIISVVANLLLIPHFGFQASAFIAFVSLMYMGYAGYYLNVFKEHNTEKYYPLLWLFATVTLTFLAYFIVEYSTLMKVSCSVVTLFSAGFLVKFLTLKINEQK